MTTTETCPTCGSPVRIDSDPEGTCSFGPVFLLFASWEDEPIRWMDEYRGMYPTLSAAKAAVARLRKRTSIDCAQIVTLTADGFSVVACAWNIGSEAGVGIQWQ